MARDLRMLLGMVAAKVGKMTPRPCKALNCKFLTQPVTVRADYDLVLKAYVRLLAARAEAAAVEVAAEEVSMAWHGDT